MLRGNKLSVIKWRFVFRYMIGRKMNRQNKWSCFTTKLLIWSQQTTKRIMMMTMIIADNIFPMEVKIANMKKKVMQVHKELTGGNVCRNVLIEGTKPWGIIKHYNGGNLISTKEGCCCWKPDLEKCWLTHKCLYIEI